MFTKVGIFDRMKTRTESIMIGANHIQIPIVISETSVIN